MASRSPDMPLEVLGTPVAPRFAALPGVQGTHGSPTGFDAVYVHVPFCTTKCHYCDFYSLAGHLHEAEPYLAALGRDIDGQIGHFGRPQPNTIFIGGGTPTLLEAPLLNRLLDLIVRSVRMDRVVEFTVEANPNTFCPDRARVLAAHGVNRVSFGAQSFLKRELEVLQRDHEPENVAQAMGYARAAGIENLNIDLIFGTPGQTLADWDYSLQRALELQPNHVSAYSLIYEPNTPMTARMKRGEFAVLDEETELGIFQHTYDTLRGAGFTRYEVSNYARPGKECRHNLHYWKGGNWMAWGPSAAGAYAGWRWKNVQNLAHYLEALGGDVPTLPITQMERLSDVRRAGESLMLWLRLAEGVNFAEFEARTGVDPRGRIDAVRKKYDDLGFFASIGEGEGLRFTEKGVVVSDHILADMLAAFSD